MMMETTSNIHLRGMGPLFSFQRLSSTRTRIENHIYIIHICIKINYIQNKTQMLYLQSQHALLQCALSLKVNTDVWQFKSIGNSIKEIYDIIQISNRFENRLSECRLNQKYSKHSVQINHCRQTFRKTTSEEQYIC